MHCHSYFINIANAVSLKSKDANTKVGAVIVDSNSRIVSTGYNGPAMGVVDLPERLTRPQKYQYFIHAELNAIIFAKCDLTGTTLYSTLQPCVSCMSAIIQSGITTIIFEHSRPDAIAEQLSLECGVRLIHWRDV
jgi:dCMP deaminase